MCNLTILRIPEKNQSWEKIHIDVASDCLDLGAVLVLYIYVRCANILS